ncbi:MAG TPA: SusD/RagB family nutrient-binding outer membrane lipoprotein [Bacteroidales bacterium]|nr:SusD/RagB family nutrient-binding outer membrane lipoprotein [Bacteroidales bacterium]
MKKILLYFTTLAVLYLTSCSESWLDVNTDPNNPTSVQPELVLPAAEMSLASQISVNYNIAGSMWAQFWTQNPTSNQYKQYDAYDIKPTTLDNEWRELYSGTLKELQRIKEESKSSEEWRLYLIAATLQAYTLQYLADLYDQIPYTEALKAEDGIMSPHYDNAQTVYDGIINDLNFALSKDLSSFTAPIDGDFVFKGDVQRWVQFANTLKLRIYLRQWKVRQSVAQAGIQELFNSNAEFLTTDAKLDVFVDQKGKGNPLYESDRRELNTKINIRASQTFIAFLTSNNDTDERIAYYFERGSSGEFKGNRQGDFNIPITADEANKISLARILATDPVYLMSAAESYFLQAEARYRLNASSAEVKTLYDNGVLAAFNRFGLNGSRHITGTGKYVFDTDNPLQSIITQKWAALAGINGMEAYLEHLRTGIPKRSNVDVTIILPKF